MRTRSYEYRATLRGTCTSTCTTQVPVRYSYHHMYLVQAPRGKFLSCDFDSNDN